MSVTAQTEYWLLATASNEPQLLKPLIDQLASSSTMDSYTLRQRLTGTGLTQLTKGSRGQLQPLAQILRAHGIECWIIKPTPPPFSHQLIAGATITPECISFTTAASAQNRSTRVVVSPESKLLVVVADVSGQLAEKQLKRLMVHNTYNGGAPPTLDSSQLQQEIFKFSPVIDLYNYDDNGNVSAAVRIFPGSFDHRQLENRAELSRNGNLLGLLEKIKERASNIQLDYQFGLGFLPCCRINKTRDSGVDNGNLEALTRYGWLLVDMAKDSPREDNSAPATAQLIPPLAVVTETLDQAGVPTPANQRQSPRKIYKVNAIPSPETTLPPPPAVETSSGIKLHLSWWRIALTAIGAIVIFISHGQANMPTLIYQYGLRTGLIPAALGLSALWGAVYFWHLKRRIENTPTSKTRSAAMGMIEVSGRAKRMYALVSPISQLPCVYYCLKKYQRNKRDDAWRVTQVTTSGNVPFILADDTGSIIVDPQGAQLSPQYSTEGVPGQSNILFSSASEANHYEKWKEEVLHDGCNLYVLGFARSIDAAEHTGNISHKVAQKLRALKTDHAALMAYDADNDGKIDAAEWDKARSDMEQQALREKLHNNQQRSNQQLVIGAPPQKGLPFIIAETESETNLTRKYSWYSPLLLFVALASIIIALSCTANYFHLY